MGVKEVDELTTRKLTGCQEREVLGHNHRKKNLEPRRMGNGERKGLKDDYCITLGIRNTTDISCRYCRD